MNRFSLSMLGAALLCALASPRIHADIITYQYDWSQSSSFVVAGGAGTGGVSIANPPTNSQATGSVTIPAASITATSSAPSSQPDTFNGQAYNMTVVLTDLTSGKSGKLSWQGHLFGTLTSTSAAITNKFDSPTSEQITLGNHLYKLTIGPFIGLNYSSVGGAPVPVADTIGTISAEVVASDVSSGGTGGGGGTTGGSGGGTTASNTPEPSTLLLAGLGLFGLLGARRARRFAPAK